MSSPQAVFWLASDRGLQASSRKRQPAVTWCLATSSLTAAVPRRIHTGFLFDRKMDQTPKASRTQYTLAAAAIK